MSQSLQRQTTRAFNGKYLRHHPEIGGIGALGKLVEDRVVINCTVRRGCRELATVKSDIEPDAVIQGFNQYLSQRCFDLREIEGNFGVLTPERIAGTGFVDVDGERADTCAGHGATIDE